MEIICLMDNLVYKEKFIAEHGLSYLIKIEGLNILFDTGQSGNFTLNAELMNEDLKKIDYLIFSHSHYDHTGGLEKFLDINQTAKIIMKKNSLNERYSSSTGKLREIGFPLKDKYKNFKNEFIFIEDDYQINEKIKIIAKIDKKYDFEDEENKLFKLKEKEIIKDDFDDELFILLDKTIVNGCAHTGIINILDTARKYSNNIENIFGGTHLKGKSIDRINKTIEKLEQFKINLYTGHCTGVDTYSYMKEKLKEKINYFYVGMNVKL